MRRATRASAGGRGTTLLATSSATACCVCVRVSVRVRAYAGVCECVYVCGARTCIIIVSELGNGG
jgi:hypothetical protein